MIWSRCAFGKGSMRDQNNTFRSGNEGVFEGEEVARSSGRCEKEARCDRDRARAWHPPANLTTSHTKRSAVDRHTPYRTVTDELHRQMA